MDVSKSLISRRDSTLLKGVLILLIVLGHNGILMGKSQGLTPNELNKYLYSFHVYLFLILPFLYNVPQFTKERIKKDFMHLYKFYTIIFFVLLFVNITILKQDFGLANTINAYISGDQLKLNEAIGANFPWFLPTMFSLLVLRNYFLNKSNRILLPFVILSFALFFAIRIFYIRFRFDLFGSITAVAYFSLAVACRYIYDRFHHGKSFNIISISVFIISTILFFTFYSRPTIPYEIIRYMVLPISTLFTLIYLVNRLRIHIIENILNYFGKESLPIYLIHVLVYQALFLIIKKYNIALDMYSGIASYILTIIITVLTIQFCKKIGIYKYLFQ